MKKILLVVAACVACLTGVAATVKNGDTVAFLGSNLGLWRTIYAFHKDTGLDKVVLKTFSEQKNVATWQKIFDEKILPLNPKPARLILGFGVSHVGKDVSLENFKKSVTELVDKAQAAGMCVVLRTTLMQGEDAANESNKKLVPYNDFLRVLAKEKSCRLADWNKEMQRRIADYRTRSGVTGNFLTRDGVNLDNYGEVLMSQFMFKEAFGFSDQQLAAYWKNIKYFPRFWFGMATDGHAVAIGGASMRPEAYTNVVEKAIAAKMTPMEFLKQKFGTAFNDGLGDFFREACWLRTDAGPVAHPRLEKVDLPIWEISGDKARQSVVASGSEGAHYQAATARADDGTIYAVWSWKHHGGPCGPMAMSKDDGKTWTRVDDRLPPVYSNKFTNCPVIYNIVDKKGKGRHFIMANLERKRSKDHGLLMSEDNGKTWVERPTEPWACWNPPTGILRLKDGSTALFGQRMQAHITNDVDRPTDDQEIWMSITHDGGLTWSPLVTVARAKHKNLCEPFAFRSDDGKEIGLLIRENRHTARSMMCFSCDEGKTWTQPMDTCRGLTGDRHQGVRAPDGRWVITYRDICPNSPSYGQYMAWVGTYDDIRHGRPGQFRIHLLHHRFVEGWAIQDTGYSGVECLPDGTILCTTYTQHTPGGGRSIVATRFKLSERDPKRDLK